MTSQMPSPQPHIKHDASISSLLNAKQSSEEDNEQQRRDYLPTPVTPANGFPTLPSEMVNYGSFAVQKEKKPSSAASSEKPYACHECDQTFSRPHNLKSHLATHSSERPFQCETCKHHFRRHHDLKRHQKLHTGERPHVCKVCHRSFARLDALNRHQRAEGGTACSAAHHQHKSRTSATPPPTKQTPPQSPPSPPVPRRATTATSITTTASSTRPTIPQLNIPHPASQPFPNEIYPAPPPPPRLPTPSTNPANNAILPSPNALPTISSSPTLTPLYVKSSTTTSSTPSPPTLDRRLPPLGRDWEQENKDLRQELALEKNKTEQLKQRIHDLEIENKVLRSLIVGNQKRSQDEDDVDDDTRTTTKKIKNDHL
ncbi:hypothetical protein EC973_008515 [Apophysomyces ossiformis]|uniref:C2H2-type domain-containing protein n=1 Tax=Apophysomyces ossiformis TaxID=679940 RepID=A0A8H7BQJ8_9FUNG|nr:hypothetical protein EC973_008515 [Apophysomyces ossiformis]